MSKDQVVGALLVLVSLVVIVTYLWLVFFPGFPQGLLPPGVDIFVLKLTGAAAIVAVFAILAWIGYTLATTPPPKPIEEIEKEIEKELKEAEKAEAKGEAESKPTAAPPSS
ncbi:MAG: transcriptional regulator [Candidatus Nezhaarchaeota archaeon]|nr:transcriptional regulator [Candidatus Nezhaarchaeota archaeon]